MTERFSIGQKVQHDPYSHLLSEQEKESARCLPFRVVTNSMAVLGISLYYMSRHHEIGRVKKLRISPDLIFQVTLRAALTFVVADQISRRMFVDYRKMT